MKSISTKILCQKVSKHLSGWKCQGSMAFICPIGHTLRAIYLEQSSSDRSAFYVWEFFLPLCVPTKMIRFNLGSRLSSAHSNMWSKSSPNLEDELLDIIEREVYPAFSVLTTELNVAGSAKIYCSRSSDPYACEAAAYMYLKGGDFIGADTEFTRLFSILDLRINWQREMAARAQWLKDRISTAPEKVDSQLLVWETETAHDLRLTQFR